MNVMKETEKSHSRFSKAYFSFSGKHPIAHCIIVAIIINMIIEIAGRHSFISFINSVVSSPFPAFYSVVIITLTLCVSLLFKKRYFVFWLIAILWASIGIANGIILMYRVTPLTGIDFSLLWSVFGIIGMYFKIWQIILMLIGIAAILVIFVLLALKTPKTRVVLKKAALNIAVLILITAAMTFVGIRTGQLAQNFKNLADAYRDYGFVYCFTRSIIDKGIDRPTAYKETISRVSKYITPDDASDAAEEAPAGSASKATPNIVMIQLESFFDPYQMTDYALSRDPIPNFRALLESCPSGTLTVPVVGAGTVNTEFEVLTGMSLDFFGTCEYPYQTVLRDTATESICTDLAANGYISHAMHNNTGTFYDRHIVYSYLGFDSFTPLEYMTDKEVNSIGWAKDMMLKDEILKALESDDERDFVFAVSVQPHGKYPRDDPETKRAITVSGGENQGVTNAVEYYVNEIAEVDEFIGELVNTFSDYPEPVMLVLYGDHLPALEIENSDLREHDIFKTEYVIWNNFGLEAESADLNSYQLSARIFELLGLDSGPVITLHNSCKNDSDYSEKLEALEYDMLYGEYSIFGGENPYLPSEMRFGTEDIQIAAVSDNNGELLVTGKAFTEYSQVYINDKKCETEYIDQNTLLVCDTAFSDGDTLDVRQIADDTTVFGIYKY